MKLDLYDYQKRIVDQARDYEGLWLQTGLGKTFVLLGLLQKKVKENLAPIKGLIIVPKIKVADWQNLVEALGIEATVIQKEKFAKEWSKLPEYRFVAVDEIHFFFSEKVLTKKEELTMSQTLREYMKKWKPWYFYGLTATPYSVTNPFNFYVAWTLFNKKPPSMGWDKFQETFFFKIGGKTTREIWKARSDQATKQRLIDGYNKLGITLRSDQALDMPEVIDTVELYQPTTEQNEAYQEMLLENTAGAQIYGYGHQIYGGGTLKANEYTEDQIFSSDKFESLMEIIELEPRIVIACKFNLEIDRIEKECLELFPKRKVFVVKGERKDDLSEINKNHDMECIILLQCAASVGFDILGVSIMVFYTCPWKYIDYEQTRGRITRGKDVENFSSLRYIHLVTMGTVDQVVYERMKNKEDFNIQLYKDKTYG